MNLSESAILDYLETNNPFTNQYEVRFDSTDVLDNTVSSPYPGSIANHGDSSLSLHLTCVNITDLINGLSIHNIADIENVQPAKLLALYEQGKAHLLCLAESTIGYSLYFLKTRNGLLAEDIDQKKHIVPVSLLTPDEMIAYTKEYYKDELAAR